MHLDKIKTIWAPADERPKTPLPTELAIMISAAAYIIDDEDEDSAPVEDAHDLIRDAADIADEAARIAEDLAGALAALLDQADLDAVDEETQPIVDAARAALDAYRTS